MSKCALALMWAAETPIWRKELVSCCMTCLRLLDLLQRFQFPLACHTTVLLVVYIFEAICNKCQNRSPPLQSIGLSTSTNLLLVIRIVAATDWADIQHCYYGKLYCKTAFRSMATMVI